MMPLSAKLGVKLGIGIGGCLKGSRRKKQLRTTTVNWRPPQNCVRLIDGPFSRIKEKSSAGMSCSLELRSACQEAASINGRETRQSTSWFGNMQLGGFKTLSKEFSSLVNIEKLGFGTYHRSNGALRCAIATDHASTKTRKPDSMSGSRQEDDTEVTLGRGKRLGSVSPRTVSRTLIDQKMGKGKQLGRASPLKKADQRLANAFGGVRGTNQAAGVLSTVEPGAGFPDGFVAQGLSTLIAQGSNTAGVGARGIKAGPASEFQAAGSGHALLSLAEAQTSWEAVEQLAADVDRRSRSLALNGSTSGRVMQEEGSSPALPFEVEHPLKREQPATDPKAPPFIQQDSTLSSSAVQPSKPARAAMLEAKQTLERPAKSAVERDKVHVPAATSSESTAPPPKPLGPSIAPSQVSVNSRQPLSKDHASEKGTQPLSATSSIAGHTTTPKGPPVSPTVDHLHPPQIVSSSKPRPKEVGRALKPGRVLPSRGVGVRGSQSVEQPVEAPPVEPKVVRANPILAPGDRSPRPLEKPPSSTPDSKVLDLLRGGVLRRQAMGMAGPKEGSVVREPHGHKSRDRSSSSPTGKASATPPVTPAETPSFDPIQDPTLAVGPSSTPAVGPSSTPAVDPSLTLGVNPSLAPTDAAPKARKPPAMKRLTEKAKPKALNQRKSAASQAKPPSAEPANPEVTKRGPAQTRAASKAGPPATNGLTLDAVVRRIVYENADNGYVIARVKAVGTVPHMPASQFDQNKASGKHGRRGWKNKGGKDGEDLLTVVGTLPKIAEGQPLRLTGNWRDNAKFGREFVATGCEEMEVSSLPDLVTYLGGGSLPKVGPVRAAAIVSVFGDQALKMLDSREAVTKLQQVPGIGRSTAFEIKAAWEERRGVRKTMDFLQLHGVASSAAQRIVRRHRDQTESLVRADPWEATAGIHGFGFEKADALARSMGTCPTLIGRRTAAIRSVLTTVCGSDGHAYLPWSEVRQRTLDLLAEQVGGLMLEELEKGWGKGPDREEFEQGLRVLVRKAKLVVEEAGVGEGVEGQAGWTSEGARCYLPFLHAAEVSLAENVAARLAQPSKPPNEKWSQESQSGFHETLSADQGKAVERAMTAPMLILTGGPGTGKTYTLRTIVALWRSMGKTVQCCAPTGRASQRLAESVGMDAKTIHRLLEYKPGENFWGKNDLAEEADVSTISRNFFARNARNPLECDALVVDEASMLDLPLADALFSAVPPNTQILLVGDIDQLPPVGPGHVLRDLINSQRVPVFRLTEVFRQAQQSAIVTNAHAINQGRFPDLEITRAKPDTKPRKPTTESPNSGGSSRQKHSGRGYSPGGNLGLESARVFEPGAPEESNVALLESSERDGVIALQSSIVQSDCLWVDVPESRVAKALEEVISPRGLLSQLNIDPRKDVQVLSPIKKGATGTSSFNSAIQGLINPPHQVKGQMEYRQVVFRKGDRVIQTSNDYERAVFNGDLGTISHVDAREKRVTVRFHNRAAGTEAEIMYGPQLSGPLASLEDLSLAWAVTVHKSQGSEYPVVLLPVSKWHHKLLSRKLIYTGLTRARKLAVVIGPRGPIETAVATITDDDRYTYLRQRLQET